MIDNDDLLAAMEAQEQQQPGTHTYAVQLPPAPEGATVIPVTDTDATIVTVPPADTDPAILADFWQRRGISLMAELRAIKDRITAAMVAGATFPGMSLTWSYEYPPDAAAEFPDLVTKRAVTATVGTEAEFQQIVEFLAEFVPEAENKFDLKIDNRKANSIILHAGQGADRLKALRSETPRLVVK
jgi:hypothetical protein